MYVRTLFQRTSKKARRLSCGDAACKIYVALLNTRATQTEMSTAEYSANVARGLAAVQSALVPGPQRAPSTHCYAPLRWRGPYPDPIGRWTVGNVERWQGGEDCSGQQKNVLLAGAAMEALASAGVPAPTVVPAQAQPGKAVLNNVVMSSGGASAGVTWGESGFAYNTPYKNVLTTAANFGRPTHAGHLVATAPNGYTLWSGLPSSKALSVESAPTLAASGSSSGGSSSLGPQLAPLGTNIWATLAAFDETLPGVTLFGEPRGNGDIANFYANGAQIAAASASDPLKAAVITNQALSAVATQPDYYGGPRPMALAASGGVSGWGGSAGFPGCASGTCARSW